MRTVGHSTRPIASWSRRGKRHGPERVSLVLLLLGRTAALAAVFGTVSGVVEDPQRRPVPQALVTLRSKLSSWQEQEPSDAEGRFSFPAVDQGFGFLPLKGERDEQYEIDAENFFDHDVIGNSNIFIPLTIDHARIRGWEATVHSPRRGRTQSYPAYSHQSVEGHRWHSAQDFLRETARSTSRRTPP